jgi:hypothetical protein
MRSRSAWAREAVKATGIRTSLVTAILPDTATAESSGVIG